MHEAGRARQVQALAEIAIGGRGHHGLDLPLQRQFDRAVAPFGHRAQACAVLAPHRGGGHIESAPAEHDAVGMRRRQPGQPCALRRRVGIQGRQLAAVERRGREARAGAAHVGLGRGQHRARRRIGVDDRVVVVGHQHAGGGGIERALHPRHLLGLATPFLDLEAEPDLHRLQPEQHAADLVVAVDGDVARVLAGGEIAQVRDRRIEPADHVGGQPPRAVRAGERGQRHQPQQRAGRGARGAQQDQGQAVAAHARGGQHQPLAQVEAPQRIERAQAVGRDPRAVAHAQRRCAIAHCRVVALGRTRLFGGGLPAHRHVAHVPGALVVGRDVRHHPVVVAVLAPVLDHAHPGAAGLQRAPQVGEGLRWHVGMTDQVVRLADELGLGEAADPHEFGIDVDDDASQVGPRDDRFIALQRELALGDGQVVAHLYFRGEGDPRPGPPRGVAGPLRRLRRRPGPWSRGPSAARCRAGSACARRACRCR